MPPKQQRQDVDPEELLDVVDKTLDRLKTMYEQYFLGIQKQAPTFIHNDIERKLRDLTQMQLRNTGLRYRLATLQQKFGSYNSYWRRTLRQIENGTYQRQLQKIGREAVRSGADIPDEILAAMPKRMRDQVMKDRETALAIARRRQQDEAGDEQLPPEADDAFVALIKEPTDVRRRLKGTDGSHLLDSSDADFDIDAFFAEVEQQDEAPAVKTRTRPPTQHPRTRTKPTTAGDLIQSGTRSPPRVEPEPAAPPQPPAHARPTQAMPKLPRMEPPPIPGRAAPPPVPGARASTQTEAMPRVPSRDTEDDRLTAKQAALPKPGAAQPLPRAPLPGMPRAPTAPGDRQPVPVDRATGPQPAIPRPPVPPPPPTQTGAIPTIASQASRPNPIAPGSAAKTGPVNVEQLKGPFPREPRADVAIPKPDLSRTPSTGVPAIPRPPQPSNRTPAQGVPAIQKPPPGMTDADVNALYAKYVKAKEMVGEKIGPGEHSKLLKTINSQAPKIMEQYKAKGVDFSVVVKDNQVIIRAKPKP